MRTMGNDKSSFYLQQILSPFDVSIRFKHSLLSNFEARNNARNARDSPAIKRRDIINHI